LWGAESPDAPASPDGQHTFGGWYVSTGDLKVALEQVGSPAAPSQPDRDGFWSHIPQVIALLGGVAVALAVFGLALVARRRKIWPAPTA
jgi:hypothetical protein